MKRRKSKSIIISGAGLAGLTAAINLAQAGYKVRVYEKKRFVGQHSRETVQMLPNWFFKEDVIEELERCNLKINWLNKIEQIEIYLGKGKIIFYSQRIPIGYTVLRGGENSLERDLMQQAEEKGVSIIVGKESSVRPDVVATGSSKVLTIGYGQVYRGKFEPNETKVFFSSSHSSSVGYTYLFPHNQELATFKISKRVDENVDLKKNLKKLRQKYLSKELKEENFLYEFGTERSFSIPKTAVSKGSFLVGEAAGFQDELFRFGMRYAIISGYLAAKAIVENLDYDRLWKRRFKKEFEKTARARKVFCDFRQEGFNLLPKNLKIYIEIEKFKRIWLSSWFNTALYFYPFYHPFLFNRFFLPPLLKMVLRSSVLH